MSSSSPMVSSSSSVPASGGKLVTLLWDRTWIGNWFSQTGNLWPWTLEEYNVKRNFLKVTVDWIILNNSRLVTIYTRRLWDQGLEIPSSGYIHCPVTHPWHYCDRLETYPLWPVPWWSLHLPSLCPSWCPDYLRGAKGILVSTQTMKSWVKLQVDYDSYCDKLMPLLAWLWYYEWCI